MNYQKVGPRKEKDTITRISINMLSISRGHEWQKMNGNTLYIKLSSVSFIIEFSQGKYTEQI